MTVLKRQPNHKQESDSLFVTDVTSGVDRTEKEGGNLNGWKRRGGGGVGGGQRKFQSLTEFYRPVNRTGSPHDELTQIQINTNSKLFFFSFLSQTVLKSDVKSMHSV